MTKQNSVIMSDAAAEELLQHNLFDGVKWTSTAYCDVLRFQNRVLKFTVLEHGVLVQAMVEVVK